MPGFATATVQMLREAGVRRLFGMPGGGGNADLIEEAGHAGLPFTLAHTETASAFMACAQAEITGRPGACLATLGPGAASIMNGVAHAHLDRVPLIVITDSPDESSYHQRLLQREMFAPLVKWSGSDPWEAMQVVTEPPFGPVHLQEASGVGLPARAAWQRSIRCAQFPSPEETRPVPRRPVLLAGLASGGLPIRQFCERHRIPALVTYKAKGVVPDDHPWFAGILTNGALERPVLDQADAFLVAGLDPVEFIRPWNHPQPIIPWDAVEPASTWTEAEVRALAGAQRERMRPAIEPGELAPHRVVEIVAASYNGARIAVDAGAHMFPVMSLWTARQPAGALISNGLSTMGFGLLAAIGAALLDPASPLVVFTGDGGLMMCLGELRTAARERLPLRIVVFADGDLSLIKLKQVQKGYRTNGVTIGDIDWQSVGCGFGVLSRRASTEDELAHALDQTAAHPGPVLIAAHISPRTYPTLIRALRGPA
jgi:acetolactate synthase-1/2/3 large subunit